MRGTIFAILAAEACAAPLSDVLLPRLLPPVKPGADPAGICKLTTQAHDETAWKKFGMDNFVSLGALDFTKAMFVDKTMKVMSLQDAWRSDKHFTGSLPDPCTDNKASCTPDDMTQFCSQAPQTMWALKALMHYTNYLHRAKDAYVSATAIATGWLAPIQKDFNPSAKSELPNEALQKGGNAFLGLIASAAPLLFPEGGIGEGIAFGAEFVKNSMENLVEKAGESKLDVRFDAYADLSKIFSLVTDSVTTAIQDRITKALVTPIYDDKGSIGPHSAYEQDKAYPAASISNGAFAWDRTGIDWSKIEDMTKGALAGLAINHAWNQEGVIIAKVSKKNLPLDPCDPKAPNNLFNADVKYCDDKGNAFILQRREKSTIGLPLYFRETYKVPGWEDLGTYHLSPATVMKSAWNNQQKYGPAGIVKADAAQVSLFITSGGSPKPEDLAMFNTLVCDFDKNPWKNGKADASQYSSTCGKYTAENALCYFYEALNDLCPQQKWGDAKWPWDQTQLIDASLKGEPGACKTGPHCV